MKNNCLMGIVALTLAFPLAAQAEGQTAIIKGDKSYQRVEHQAPAPATAETDATKAEAVANVQPAAGDEATEEASEASKPGDRKDALREQMQLPRKNF